MGPGALEEAVLSLVWSSSRALLSPTCLPVRAASPVASCKAHSGQGPRQPKGEGKGVWEALRGPTRGSPALGRVLLGSSVCGWGVVSSSSGLLGAGVGGRLVASTCLSGRQRLTGAWGSGEGNSVRERTEAWCEGGGLEGWSPLVSRPGSAGHPAPAPL